MQCESLYIYHGIITVSNTKDRNNIYINEILDSLPQASHTMTWSIVGDDEPEKMAECYIRSKHVFIHTWRDSEAYWRRMQFLKCHSCYPVEQTKEDNHQ